MRPMVFSKYILIPSINSTSSCNQQSYFRKTSTPFFLDKYLTNHEYYLFTRIIRFLFLCVGNEAVQRRRPWLMLRNSLSCNSVIFETKSPTDRSLGVGIRTHTISSLLCVLLVCLQASFFE